MRVASADPCPHGSQNYLAYIPRHLVEIDALLLGELSDFQVQLDHAERVSIVSERMRYGIAGDQPGNDGLRVGSYGHFLEKVVDDPRKVGVRLRDSVICAPVLGRVEHDRKSLGNGRCTIRLRQPGTVK